MGSEMCIRDRPNPPTPQQKPTMSSNAFEPKAGAETDPILEQASSQGTADLTSTPSANAAATDIFTSGNPQSATATDGQDIQGGEKNEIESKMEQAFHKDAKDAAVFGGGGVGGAGNEDTGRRFG